MRWPTDQAAGFPGAIFEESAGRLALGERLVADQVSRAWPLLRKVPQAAEVDASRLEVVDGAGLAFLWSLRKSKGASLVGLRPSISDLLKPFEQLPEKPSDVPARESSLVVQIGRNSCAVLKDAREQISFIGELVAKGCACLFRPHLFRWTDMWLTAEKAGVDALVVAGTVSFLTGMIMAFQAAVPLRQFGVDIFVVNLVALAILRELGPIMTAVVLAGRTGSSFAAEIGTMKVNEEIDALRTMGLDPVQFLVLPRVVAGLLVTPVLTAYANVLGVAGGFLVMMAQGFPFGALWVQLVGAVGVSDVMTGMIKSFVFGSMVSGVGCLRGLQTGKGATAVGESTTRAVVSGIFLIVLVDAGFAGLFNALKW